MNTNQFIESLEKSYKDALEIVKKKNKDYATNLNPFRNFEYAQLLGVPVEKAILVRITDKLARVCNLIDQNERAVIDERIEDTLLDMMNYTAILKTYLESKNDTGK